MIVFRIKDIREKKNISLSLLSKLTKVSRAYLFDLENNRKTNPTLQILLKIANVLDVNIKDLFYTRFDIEILKQEMYQAIDDYGIDSSEVLKISQLIDLLINIDMNEKKN